MRYGNIVIDVCGACDAELTIRTADAGGCLEYGILQLDPFHDPTGLLHIEMDDGSERPLCTEQRIAYEAWRVSIGLDPAHKARQ